MRRRLTATDGLLGLPGYAVSGVEQRRPRHGVSGTSESNVRSALYTGFPPARVGKGGGGSLARSHAAEHFLSVPPARSAITMAGAEGRERARRRPTRRRATCRPPRPPAMVPTADGRGSPECRPLPSPGTVARSMIAEPDGRAGLRAAEIRAFLITLLVDASSDRREPDDNSSWSRGVVRDNG